MKLPKFPIDCCLCGKTFGYSDLPTDENTICSPCVKIELEFESKFEMPLTNR